ncbi:MAG TPA: hypothetical protein VHM94_13645, partial [Acidimicrobiia bacterium]|nr:hypothetical protein [Acidimicrobiia bacterium]
MVVRETAQHLPSQATRRSRPDDAQTAEAPDEVQLPVPAQRGSVPPVSQPTKLIRIASMTRAMLDEVRQAP